MHGSASCESPAGVFFSHESTSVWKYLYFNQSTYNFFKVCKCVVELDRWPERGVQYIQGPLCVLIPSFTHGEQKAREK